MLYETFNANKESFGQDFFTSRLDSEIVRNLNPKFELREYQKEALGRFDFYFTDFQKRQRPAQLLFHMATGSGKTLVMAGNILQLYRQDYRNFIFFTRLGNVVEKTKDNFLNKNSSKYLFNEKIKFDGKEVNIREVDNFETASPDDINIMFGTTALLHTRLNAPCENAITYEEFKDKKIVLLADEAHNLNAETKKKLTKTEAEEKRSWEETVSRILAMDAKNILLEFTATIGWEGDEKIRKKYEDRIIFEYDLKHFRLDRYSKEIDVLQADLEPVERALQAMILSQYRRKVAEKNRLYLKPVVLLKSKTIKESGENFENFIKKLKSLKAEDIKKVQPQAEGTALEQAFEYFNQQNISFDNLAQELKGDFSDERIMLLDSQNIDEEKQLKLNSLEDRDNEIRAIFAVGMLNEGWDVLNLFDIVRLYDTRDGKWIKGKYKPGNTTIGEAQLIGRGARYYPFSLEEYRDKYRRKFDDNTEHELRVLETLHYHSAHNPKYIDEIKNALIKVGLIPERDVVLNLFVKDSFKQTEFWKDGVIFLNKRVRNDRVDIFSLKDAEISGDYKYALKTGFTSQVEIMDETSEQKSPKVKRETKNLKLKELGSNVVRTAVDRLEFYHFDTLNDFFPNLTRIEEFVLSDKYLGSVKVAVTGARGQFDSLSQNEKLQITLNVLKTIADEVKKNVSEYRGTNEFKARLISEVFHDKIVKLDVDEVENRMLEEINLEEEEWFAQNEIYGTSEEQSFIMFMDAVINELQSEYEEVGLLRNEKFFKVYNFDDGQAFEPDFVMFLKKDKQKKSNIYQMFVEPKGDQFKDKDGDFADSKEGWKQELLFELEKRKDLDLTFENREYKMIGLPFYNEATKKDFEKVFEAKLL